jgi:hypothetical protein
VLPRAAGDRPAVLHFSPASPLIFFCGSAKRAFVSLLVIGARGFRSFPGMEIARLPADDELRRQALMPE